MRHPRALALGLALSAAACSHRFDPRLVEAPIAARSWVSTEQVSHPLVGRIWDVRAARFVDEATLVAAVISADFVALGEVHDNPDHHLLQARLVRAITASGRRPALAFEMLTADQQASVDAALAGGSRHPDALAEVWKTSRWPDFQYYRPIFAAGLDAGLPVVAANLPRDQVKQIALKGRDALDEDLRVRLARDEPIPDEVIGALRDEMSESHCGALPEAMIDPLVVAQRARDARMAERLVSAGAASGAILITGNGHARVDRGVPAVVAKDAPGKKMVAVSFEEVRRDANEPARYEKDWGTGPLPFDFVVFTPQVKRNDPCAGMPERMRKRRAAAEKAQPNAAPDLDAPPGANVPPDAADAAPGAAAPEAPER